VACPSFFDVAELHPIEPKDSVKERDPMQSTKDLISQYGRTHQGELLAARLRKRIRKRAADGDQLALLFRAYRFRPGNVPQIQAQIAAFFKGPGRYHV